MRGTNGRRTQIARARMKQWTPRAEARFLAALAACCNVTAACRAVGLSQASAYNHYHRWPDFATRWDAALEEGYMRLEMALIENAGRAFERRRPSARRADRADDVRPGDIAAPVPPAARAQGRQASRPPLGEEAVRG